MTKSRESGASAPNEGHIHKTWYVEKHPHVAQAGVDPNWYYRTVGSKVGHAISPADTDDIGFRLSGRAEGGHAPRTIRAEVETRLVFHLELNTLGELKRRIQEVRNRPRAAPQPTVGDDWHKQYQLLKESEFFDRDWYLRHNADVKRAGLDPVRHFLNNGRKEQRHPSLFFDTERYLRTYQDARESNLNPLVHYLRIGRHKGYEPRGPVDAAPWWARLVQKTHDWPSDVAASGTQTALQAAKTVTRLRALDRGVAVVVPVFNAITEVRACLESLLRHTPANVEIIVMDDASTDPDIWPMLASFGELAQVRVIQNPENLGYTRTINRGIDLADRRDVVFLNSDTEVTPGWIRRLRVAAYSGDRVASATPLSNNAGAFSAPVFGQHNPVPAWLDLAGYGRAVGQGSRRVYPETPTGNGFCFYVRRDVIDEVGAFDGDAFPRGYGEENDFCMRARAHGWTHVVDDATLIYHIRSASFGAEKQTLMSDGREVVDARYPEYKSAVNAFTTGEAVKTALGQVGRVQEQLALEPRARALPRALFVVSTPTGGTPQTNADLMDALQDRVETFVLRCNASTVFLSYHSQGETVRLESRNLDSDISGFPHRSEAYDAILANWLIKYDIDLMHVRHIAWHSLGLIDVASVLGVSIVFSFHDFYAVCPTVTLLDENNLFCGGICTQGKGDCSQPLWQQKGMPKLKHAAIHEWKQTMGATLAKCDAFVTTTPSAYRILTQSFPFLTERDFQIIPHGRDFEAFHQLAASFETLRNEGQVLRVLVPGNLSASKGSRILEEISQHADAMGFELHCLGRVQPELTDKPGIILHGTYRREEFAEWVAEIQPHVGAVLSIWAETYCHTLTELWATGVPVIGFDIGAVGDRVRATGAGWLPDEISAEAVLETIKAIRDDPDEVQRKIDAVVSWQKREGGQLDCLAMSHPYYDIYRRLLTPRCADDGGRPRVAVLPVGATFRDGQLIGANGSAYVRLVEKTEDGLQRPVRYDFQSAEQNIDLLTQRYDAVLVQRTALAPEHTDAVISACTCHGCKLFYELDDDLTGERVSRPGSEYADHGASIEKLVRAAHRVFVSTPELARRYASHTDRITVEPNAISEPLWLKPIALSEVNAVRAPIGERGQGEIRVIYAGSATHAGDLELLKEPLQRLRAEGWQVRLFIVGVTTATEDWFTAIPIPNQCKPYPRFVPWLRQILGEMDLGVAPLVDDVFNAAKSDLKFLEYAAGGLATVASNVLAYRGTIMHGETGLLAQNTSEDWTAKLRQLLSSAETRESLANNAQAYVMYARLMHQRIATFDGAITATVNEPGERARPEHA